MAGKDLPAVAMREALDGKLAGSISTAWTGLNDRWTRRAKDVSTFGSGWVTATLP